MTVGFDRAPGTWAGRVSATFDPPSADDFWDGSELARMVDACETATDQFVRAVDAHSVAEAAYLRAFHTAWQGFVATAKSKADADRMAEHESVEERIAEKRAEGLMGASQALMRTRLSVLSAAQSHLRAVERQT